MNRTKEFVIFGVIAALVLAASFYSGGLKGITKGNQGTIKIAYNNYVETIAVSHMWKQLLEEKGYSVKLIQTEKAPLWTGVASGSADINPEVWLPTTDKPFYDKYKDKIELHKPWYKGTNLGLVVPEYMKDVDSIEDLNANKDKITRDGKPTIVGIDSGASLMKLTEQVIKDYNLDYELLESSEPAMLSELDKAYKAKKPVVVTLWNPHWAFNEYKLKYLKDPKGIYGKKETIYYATRQGFQKDHPEVVKYMDNWNMDDKNLGELILAIEKSKSPEEGTKKWIKDHRNLVDQWLKEK